MPLISRHRGLRAFAALLLAYCGTTSLIAGKFVPFAPSIKGATPDAVQLRKAFAALEQQHLAEAQADFLEALRLYPERVEARIGLAEIARERKDPAHEEAWLRRALEVNGGTGLAYRSWAHYLAAKDQTADAEIAFRKAAAIDRFLPDALVELGDMELDFDNTEKAIEAYREALARNRNAAQAHLGLGTALAGANRLSEAVAEFREAERLNPSAPGPRFSLGVAYGAIGEQQKAIEALSKVLETNPKYAPAWVSRGDAYEAKGDHRHAMSDYSAALKLDPKAGIVYFKIGLVHLAANRIPDAERFFQSAVQADPNIAAAWNDLAFLAADRKSNLDAALEWAKKATSLDPGDAGFADTLAWVYRARGELNLAAQTLEQIPKEKRSPTILSHLGQIDSERGRKTEAAAAYFQSFTARTSGTFQQARKGLGNLRFGPVAFTVFPILLVLALLAFRRRRAASRITRKPAPRHRLPERRRPNEASSRVP